ncbi:hypothetical protein B484DRAFT_451568 [Ochromonadaceae sp. CCMP2298]|nr:hypothetical protein B484DRAFT_451568 [Ochromonadaceae sp. CCMP2298]
MPRTCSYCYMPLDQILCCSRCSKHPYCSQECKTKDWGFRGPHACAAARLDPSLDRSLGFGASTLSHIIEELELTRGLASGSLRLSRKNPFR